MKAPAVRLVDAACVLALIALGAMSWSIVDARPVPVFLAMSAGQAAGTLSLGLFLSVLVFGATRKRRPPAAGPS